MHGKVGKETCHSHGLLHLGLEANPRRRGFACSERRPCAPARQQAQGVLLDQDCLEAGSGHEPYQNIVTAALIQRFSWNAMKEIYNKDASPSIHLKNFFITLISYSRDWGNEFQLLRHTT
jgi:hypothetical protein